MYVEQRCVPFENMTWNSGHPSLASAFGSLDSIKFTSAEVESVHPKIYSRPIAETST